MTKYCSASCHQLMPSSSNIKNYALIYQFIHAIAQINQWNLDSFRYYNYSCNGRIPNSTEENCYISNKVTYFFSGIWIPKDALGAFFFYTSTTFLITKSLTNYTNPSQLPKILSHYEFTSPITISLKSLRGNTTPRGKRIPIASHYSHKSDRIHHRDYNQIFKFARSLRPDGTVETR